jgi:hypothetical protein
MDESKILFHEQENLMVFLKDIKNVTYTPTPAFVIDWEKMELVPWDKALYPNATAATVRMHKLRNIESGISFVKKNRYQIVVYRFVMPGWTEGDGVCRDPRPFLQYAQKPGTKPIYVDEPNSGLTTPGHIEYLIKKWAPFLNDCRDFPR